MDIDSKDLEANSTDYVHRFIYEQTLNSFIDKKTIIILGHIEGWDENYKAIAKIEKQEFTEISVLKLASNETSYILNFENAEQFFNNDIYYKYKTIFPEWNTIHVEIIFPASEKLIMKYSEQQMYFIEETPEMYEAVTKPYIDSLPVKDIQWLYNILEGTAEPETWILTVTDEENSQNSFTLRRDLKYHEGDLRTLYCNSYPFRRDIKSLRDLNESHLELLESMNENWINAICEMYNISSRSQIVSFVHYLPTYYHLHVHFCHQKYLFDKSANIGKCILMKDIIDNIKMDGSYSGAQKKSQCAKIDPWAKHEPCQHLKNFNKKIYNHLFISNRMYLYLSDANHPTVSSELFKKFTGSQKLQIANGNEKLYTMLSQINSLQNSRQKLGNIHNGFQPLASIITERFDKTLKDQSNYYLREETTQNKTDEP